MENIKNYLLDHIGMIGEIVNEINCLDGSLNFLEYWENDEEFFTTFFYNNPMEAVRASYFGNYDFSDEYVKFDGYGNLTSANDHEIEEEYKDYIDDVVSSLLDNYYKISLSDNELIKLIEEVNE